MVNTCTVNKADGESSTPARSSQKVGFFSRPVPRVAPGPPKEVPSQERDLGRGYEGGTVLGAVNNGH